MGYDLGDSFPFYFEPNEIPFGSKSKGKPSPRSYNILCERKWKHSFLSAIDSLPGRESQSVLEVYNLDREFLLNIRVFLILTRIFI